MFHFQRRFVHGFVAGCALWLTGCEATVYWQNLPPPAKPRVVRLKDDDPAIARALALATKLVDVKPFPASTVFVMTNEYFYRREKLARIPDRAFAARCTLIGEEKKEGLPPSAACISLPGQYIDLLSEEALAAVIAHELGHIEKGHRTWSGAAEPTLAQWEADEAASERLRLAGYCPARRCESMQLKS